MKAFRLLIALSLLCASASNPPELLARAAIEKPVADLNYQTVSNLQRGKTTIQEIKTLLGSPNMIDSKDQQTQWYYRTDKVDLRLQFSADHILAGYEYKSSDSNATYKVEVQQVKSLSTETTNADLTRLVGEPTYAVVSVSGKELYYRDLSSKSTLKVVIDDKAGLVTNYLFLEEGPKEPIIDAEKVTDINKGETTAAELINFFGKPTRLMIDKDKESWYYVSGGTQLLIDFSQGDKKTVSNYQYSKR